MSGRISRLTFLKLLGFGTVALSVGGFLRFNPTADLKKLLLPFPSASAQSAGSWAQGPDTTTIAIHAALLPSGKILYLAGSGYHTGRQDGPFDARIRDVNTGSEQTLTQSRDSWCAGQCGLPNGNILFAGGTLMYDTNINNCNGAWHGVNAGYEVDESSGSPLTEVASMAQGRWYPTCVTLPDGRVLVVNGFDELGTFNLLAEIYDPNSKTWSISYDPSNSNTYCVGAGQPCAGAGSPCYGSSNHGVAPNTGLYPRMHLMPSGLVITAGQSVTIRSWDPATGIWNIITQTSSYRDYGTTFLLPLQNTSTERGKILIVGGDVTASDPALRTVEIVDFNAGTSTNPVVRNVASINTARKYLLPVILPTGRCVIFAGFDPGPGAYTNTPEMFDPVAETWTNLPAATVPRGYHGVALLLPDGRVWTAGATPNESIWELRTEFFSPSYFFQTRPTISGNPTVGDYGSTIVIPTPDGPNITSVSLVRLGATTHHYDANLRLLWLQIVNSNSSSVTVSAPINARLAPPGYYMIFILNGSQVPSVARIIRIPGTGSGGDTTAPAQVANLAVTPVGSTELDLSWNANTEPDLQRYNVYRGTTAGFPVTLGTTTPLAQPTTNSFSNTGLTASTTYYYKVSAVDTSGNIGPLSTEISGTTANAADTTAPAQVANLAVIPFSSTQLNLSWNANTEPDLQRYNVYRGTTAGFPVTLGTTTPLAQPTTNSFSNTGLTASTTYYYKVSAVDTSGNIGPLSTEVSGTTANPPDTTPPAQVANLAVIPFSSTQLNLSWNANTEPDLQRYNVYRGTTAGFPVTLGTTTPLAQPTTNSFSNTGLTASTTYYYKVSAVDTSGNIGPLSTEVSGTTANPPDTTPPAQVANLAVTPFSSTQLNLSWNANTEPDLQRYNVYRGTTAGFPVTLGTTTPLAQPTTNSLSNTGLTASTTYYYKVSAVDTSGNIGPLSAERSGTTVAATGQVFYNVAIPGNSAGILASNQSTRYGEEANTASSILVGKSLKTWKVRLRKVANPSGPVTARIRRRSDDAIVASFNETINSTTLPSAFAEFTFTLTNPYTIQTGDRILIEYNGPQSVRLESWNVNVIDGINTRRTRYDGTTYVRSDTEDITGTMSSVTGSDTTPPTQVANLAVTPFSSTQLNLSWNVNTTDQDLDHYNVYRGTTAGFPVTLGTTTPLAQPTTNSFSNTGLTASTTYYYKVSAVDTSGNIGPLSTEVSGTTANAADTTAPAQVANLAVTPVGSTQLNLSWNANTEPDLQRYNVYRGTTAGFPVTLGTTTPLAQPTTNSFSNTGLTASTTYYYKVSAVDTSGNIGPLSTEISGTTAADTTAPAQVANLAVIPFSSTQLNLSWNANTEPDLQRYNVYRGTTAGFPVTLGTTTPLAQPTTNSFSNTGLTASTTYYYKVSAVDTSGNIGPLSTEISGTTAADTTAPAQVANLAVTPVGSTQLNLSWNANTEPDLQRYNVYRGTTAGFPVTLGTTTPLAQPTTNSFSNTGLTASTTYYYKVSAVDTSGNIGPLSTEVSGTTANPPDTTAPAQVTGLTVTPFSSTQLNLSWDANTTDQDLNHYNVYRGTSAGFVVTPGTTVPTFTPMTNSISNTGLSPSTTYYYKVAAVDNSGNIGLLSTEQSGTTNSGADTTPPAQVTGLTVTPFSSTQLNLSWNANTTDLDLNHYNVYRGTTAGFVVTPGTTVPAATPTANSFSNTGLSPSTTYYYRVAAEDNSGNIGLLSTEQSGTTQIAQSYSILFDGVDDLINCSNDATLWSQSLTRFSFSFWMNVSSINLTNRTLVQHGYASNQSFLCHRDNGNGDVVWFRIRNATGTDILAGTASSPSILNRWAHITCVYDSSLGSANLKIYEDGILGGTTGNLTQAINLSAALTLNGAIAGFQAGRMKDFRWWTTKALTQAEINAIRDNLPSAPIPNYWLKMEEGAGNPIDSISGTKVATLVGGASWST